MKLRRARKSKRGRIEIIPMIDVMFFLLATFILTSLAMQRVNALHIDLPQGRAQTLAQTQPVTLAIDAANHLFIDGRQVEPDQLAASVKRAIHADGDLVVAADDHASHGVVVQAMLAARAGGAVHFLIAVHRE
ncbi:ExbD/TolR family protein [Paraburkholderia caballeronis]|uniref:Outer membrane transport energization protein ExbD n=1 Tax=Paraburkholderia caballeronis TaxID=416943 RepID=A0A1H7S5C2_9BURK|nr:biopolymer transporter ExbD [Paraburkholderia caballeronis]PXW22882.1 outer membrane transport energization protein ExbD [Paraburkholderia caballeronis]PXW97267.1 outer membrane transport energization protein ExbD [Paraburkholderia caballeronis]RAJ93787.1 outer membrane transport energization protein ExbD [Paraburkholderia caballeronis]TDV39052.1 outer membrane transport energization protein ExbD [Paraburkholderia caballeronis]SED58570.1 outer membrane transport energization protein ExbD [P